MLSREWHPDKIAHRRQRQRMKRKQQKEPPPPPPMDENIHVPPPPPPPPPSTSHKYNEDNNDKDEGEEGEEYARRKLQQITNAYEILNNDHTRLLYHKYGIIESSNNAIIQLLSTGQVVLGRPDHQISSTSTSEEEEEKLARLLELMGYPSNLNQSASQEDNIHQEASSSWKQQHENHHSTPTTQMHLQQQRISYLTSTITERIRPLVEGTINQDLFVSEIYRECNALKKIGLGAHILRCIGRAYRIEGYRVLRTMSTSHHHRKRSRRRRRHHGPRHTSQQQQHEDIADLVIDTVRNMKHYASAAFAGGKLVLLEQRIKKLEEEYARGKQQVKKQKDEQQQKKRQHKMDGDEKKNGKMIQPTPQDYGYQTDDETTSRFVSNIGALPGDDTDSDANIIDATYSDDDDDFLFQQHFSYDEEDDDNNHDELEDELNHIQHKKTYTALLSVHQMEALWKITKIELYHTIRKACRCILLEPSFTTSSPHHNGWHYDISSQVPPPPPPPYSSRTEYYDKNDMHSTTQQQSRSQQKYDGWVNTMGKGIPLEVGRLRAAAALILIGDIMVQASKEV